MSDVGAGAEDVSSPGTAQGERIDEMLGRAYRAINDGDHETASQLARRVLSIDHQNPDAEDLLTLPAGQGEIRRLNLMFADLVDSTDLSSRVEPEVYRAAVGRYKERVQAVVDRYEAHIVSIKGDGLLIVFGYPVAHEDDVERAVQAGLEITHEVADLSRRIHERFGFDVRVRVGVHRGLAYLDLEQEDIYGLAANLAARVSSLAPPGSVVVSATVEPLVRTGFDLTALPAQLVKGIERPVEHYQVLGERTSRRSFAVPIVGRAAELRRLEELWQEAIDGGPSGRAVAICGEAGIGKSHLANVVVDAAVRAGATVLQLAGSSQHSDVGLHPLRVMVERFVGIGRDAPPEVRLAQLRGALANVDVDPDSHVPLLALVLGIAPKAGYEPVHAEGARLLEQTVEAAVAFLLACATATPPTLVFAEDLHWFDADSREVLRRALEVMPRRSLVLMTSREPPAALPPSWDVEVLDLEPLSDEEAEQLIVTLHPAIDHHEVRSLKRRCGGIPLYIDQVVAAVRNDAVSTGEIPVPDTLYETLMPRLRDRDARQVIEAAAVIGTQFDLSLVATVAGLGEGDVDRAVAELLAGRVLEGDGDSLQFRHELVREVAAELPPPSRRRQLHSDVADAMSRAAARDWRVIASHYERAARFDEAATTYARVSEAAHRRGAIPEAQSYLTRGLELVEQMSPGEARTHREVFLRLRRGFLFYAAEGAASPSAAADFERCLQLRERELAPDILMTLTALYAYYVGRADLTHALQVLETLEQGLGLGGPNKWPTLTAGFGMVEWYRGQFDAALTNLEEGVDGRAMVGGAVHAAWFMPNEPVASMHTHLAMARCVRGDLVGADEQFAEARRRCGEVGFPEGPYSLAYARSMEVLMRVEAADLDRAAAIAGELSIDADLHGFDFWVGVGRAQEAMVAALADIAKGQPATTLDRHVSSLSEVVERWRADGVLVLLPSYDGALARVLLAAGRILDARARIEAGLTLARTTTMQYYDAELLRLRARTQDRPDDCVADLRAAIDLAKRQGAWTFELRAAADLVERLGSVAHPELAGAISRLPADSNWPELSRAASLLARP